MTLTILNMLILVLLNVTLQDFFLFQRSRQNTSSSLTDVALDLLTDPVFEVSPQKILVGEKPGILST